MPKPTGLILRSKTYYARVRVPMDVRPFFPKGEVVRTLRTRSYDEARKRIHTVLAGIEAEFEKIRKASRQQKEEGNMLAKYGEHELTSLALKWFHDMQARQEKRRINDTCSWSKERLSDYRLELKQEELLAREEVLGIEQQDKHEGRTLAAKLLKAEEITFERNSEQFRMLGHLFSKAIHNLARQNLLEMQGKFATPLFPVQQVSAAKLPSKMITMRQLFDEYLKDPSRHRGRATIKNYNVIQRAVDEVIGGDSQRRFDSYALAHSRYGERKARQSITAIGILCSIAA